MTVSECKRRMTERERDAWILFMREEYCEPSLTDQYLMQLTAVVAGLFAKKQPGIDKFRLRFRGQKRRIPQSDMSEKEKILGMFAAAGVEVEHR